MEAKGKGKGAAPPVPKISGAPRRAPTSHAAKPSGSTSSLAEQLAAKSLRRVALPEEKKYFEDTSVEKAEYLRKYFASAADQWMFIPGLAAWTFQTEFLELPVEAARDLLAGQASTCASMSVAASINKCMQQKGWSLAFCKLTTFSPKDSPLVLREAAERLAALPPASGPGLLQQLNNAMTESLCVADGQKAVRLLASSARVKSDLDEALASAPGAPPVPNLCLRRWDGALPIYSEFRGFVWEGKLNAVGQYVYNLYFEELQDDQRLRCIERDIREAWAELGPLLVPMQPTCIIDFAWDPEGFSWADGKKVVLIEVNPFDGVDLGMGELTTGIFKLRDDPSDLDIVKNGPFELRVQRSKMSEEEFQSFLARLPSEQREILEHAQRRGAKSV